VLTLFGLNAARRIRFGRLSAADGPADRRISLDVGRVRDSSGWMAAAGDAPAAFP